MEDTRDRILNAAQQLYEAGGREAVTMRAVAGRLGLTATALYRHFDSKQALVQEVVSRGFRTFASYLFRALEGDNAEDRLHRSGRMYLAFALEQPEMYRSIFMARAFDPERRRRGADPRRGIAFQFLVDRVREAMEARALKQGDAEEVALTVWACVHGLASLFIAGMLPRTEQEFPQLFEESLERLLAGLRE